ncbi:hypothetical protein [Candidatus Poriferisocius sp.]|uniref:hypothetical protein n=1 Tax=Candidatus Poriferisocius sp. TaxID=3101276 RepID=UPI003B51FD54
MSDEDRSILNDVLDETANWVTEQIVSSEAELVGWFREQGTNVNEVDRAPFIEAVAPALTTGDLPFSVELYESLQAIPDAG